MQDNNGGIPVLPISARELAAATRAGGMVLLRHQNDIVAVAHLIYPSVPFERGATDEEIVEAWREQADR